MTPNTQITQENVGLLKAGDVEADQPKCKNKGGDVDAWSAGCLVPGCTSEMGVSCRNPNKDERK